MAVRSFTFKNPGSQLGYSQNLARLGDTNLYVAPKGTSADPLDSDNWVLLGVVNGEATINPNIEKYEVITGSPQSRKASFKIQQTDSLSVTLSHVTFTGMNLLASQGSVDPTITKAADGQTTVSSSTDNFTTVLTSSANIAAGDACVVENTVKEIAFIESVSGNTVTHNFLSQQPAGATNFHKIDGTSLVASGIAFNAGGCNFTEYEFLIVRYLHCSKYMFLEHRPRGQVTASEGFVFSPSEAMTGAMTIDFIDQGSDTDGIYYGQDILIPNES